MNKTNLLGLTSRLKSSFLVRVKLLSSKIFVTYDKDTYLFLAINGAGLGHLTRSLGIAKKLVNKRPHVKVIFFTTSIGVSLVNRAGFTCYHVPPAAFVSDRVSISEWNILFAKQLQAIVELYRPSVLVFDGTNPYVGLLKIIKRFSKIQYVWVKRGLYKNGALDARLKKFISVFDFVIVPGEVSVSKSSFDNGVAVVEPIIMCDTDEMLPRDAALAKLNLSTSKKNIYVQLGAGNINDTVSLQKYIVALLSSRSDVQVVVGHSPISLQAQDVEGAINYESYPNSICFAAFDLLILAAGYNSVCEAIYHQIPTIFIPNGMTKSDDQTKRALMAENYGCSCLPEPFSDEEFLLAVDRYLMFERKYVKDKPFINGADAAAEFISHLE